MKFSWNYSNPDPTDLQSAFYIEVKENVLGSSVTTIEQNSSNNYYIFTAGSFLNGKTYVWRVKTKDTISSLYSDFSDWVIFKCSAPPLVSLVYPYDNAIVNSDIPTYQHTYSDPENTLQSKYKYVVYLDDGVTVVWDSGDIVGSGTFVIQPQGILVNNTYYKIRVFATDNDGITGYSSLNRFYTNWVISEITPQFEVIPDDENARMQLKWSNIASIEGYHTGSTQYDNPDPVFVRLSIAYKKDGTAVDVNTPRYENGKFGQAVMVEEGTTNIIPQDFETQWSAYTTESAMGTTVFRTDSIFGKVLNLKKIDTAVGRYGRNVQIASGMSGSVYAHSVYVRSLSSTGRIACMYIDAAKTGGGLLTSVNYINLSDLPLGIWTEVSKGANFSPDTLAGSANCYIWIDSTAGECEFAFPKVELKGYATSYTPTTRVAETLTIPTSEILDLQKGTIELVWIPKQPNSGILNQSTSPRILQIGNYYQNNSLVLWAYHNSGSEPSLSFYIKGSSNSGWSLNTIVRASGSGWYTVGQPIYLAIKWQNSNTFWVSVNGVTYGPYTITDALTGWAGNMMWLGSGSSDAYPNALYDDFRISFIDRTNAEITAVYQSNQPLPVDEYTTYKLNFDGNLVNDNNYPLLFQSGILNSGLRLGKYTEKLYWIKSIPDIFTITNRYILKSSKINTLLYLYKDNSNYIRLSYDSVGQKFICTKCIDGYIRTYGSPTVNVPLNTNLAYAIKQNNEGLFIYTQVNGITSKWGDL